MSLSQLNPLIEMICKEKGVARNVVIQGLEKAFATMARKRTNCYMGEFKAEYSPEEDTIKLLRYRTVVEKIVHTELEMTLEEAKKLDSEVELGDSLGIEISPKIFTRNDIITIGQMVKSGNLTAQREVILNEFSGRKLELVTGQVKQIDAKGNIHVALGKTDGIIPRKELMLNDDIVVNTKIEAILLEVGSQNTLGDIILSRAHHMFAYRMLESECSEIADGTITIEAIAREPGVRTKVIVASDVERDPVKVVVGNKGYHIQQLMERMNGEKINVIAKGTTEKMLVEAVSPGKFTKSTIEDDSITLVVDDEDLGKTVGKRGANIRLAASVLGKKINIVSENKLREKTTNARKEFDQLSAFSLVEIETLISNKVMGLNTLSKMSAKAVNAFLNTELEKVEMALTKAKQLVQENKLPEVTVVESFAIPTTFDLPNRKNKLSEKAKEAMMRQNLKESLNMK